MEYWKAALLGLLQGVTEFIPVSSSGHLRVAEHFFGFTEPQTAVDVVLHLATLMAVVVFFRREVVQLARAPFAAIGMLVRGEGWTAVTHDQGVRGLWFVFLGSIPTAFLGYYLGKRFEAQASSIVFVACMFLVNTCVLLASRYVSFPLSRERMNRGFHGMRFFDALLIGIIQGFAVVRGISRSGSTIAMGIIIGVDRETAGRFSFLLSIPAICGATVFALREFESPPIAMAGPLLLGAAVAFVSGAIALAVLMKIVKKGKLHRFAWYTGALGTFLLLWHYYGDELVHCWRVTL